MEIASATKITFACASCEFYTTDEEDFKKHIQADHRTDLWLWCKNCEKCFSKSSNLVLHIKEANCSKEQILYRCWKKKCSFRSRSGQEFVLHIQQCSRGNPYIYCADCSRIFTVPHCLILHMQSKCTFKGEKNQKNKEKHISTKIESTSSTTTYVADVSGTLPASPVAPATASPGNVPTLQCQAHASTRERWVKNSRNNYFNSDNKDPHDPNSDETSLPQLLSQSAYSARQIIDTINSDLEPTLLIKKSRKFFEPVPKIVHCPCCNFSTVLESQLRHHYVASHKHEKETSCLECNRNFEHVDLFIQHFYVHEKDTIFIEDKVAECRSNSSKSENVMVESKPAKKEINASSEFYKDISPGSVLGTASEVLPQNIFQIPCRTAVQEKLAIESKVKSFEDLKSNTALVTMRSELKLKHFFKCTVLNCTFTTNDGKFYLNHLNEYHKHKKFHCTYCFQECFEAQFLIIHMLQEHSECCYQCSACFYRAVSKPHVQIHIRNNHKTKKACVYSCDLHLQLNYSFSKKSTTDTTDFVTTKPYICAINDCKYQSFHRKEFTKHTYLNHRNISQLPCHYCHCDFLSMKELVRHYQLHGISTFQCKHCVHGCETKEEILRHICNAHANKPFKIFVRDSQQIELHGKPVISNSQQIENHGKPVISNSQQIELHGKPVISNSQQIERHGKPFISNSQQIELHGKPVISNSQQIEHHGKPVISHSQQIELHGKTVISNSQQIEFLGKPVINNSQQTELHGKPVISNFQQIEHHGKPVISNSQQIKILRKPVINNSPQIELRGKPVISNSQQVEFLGKPIINNSQQIELHGKPVISNFQQIEHHGKPVISNSQQIKLLRKPVINNSPQIELRGKPVISNSQQIELHGKPVINNSQQIELHGKPVISHSQQIERHGKPVISNSQQIELHGKPVISNSLQIKLHGKPVISNVKQNPIPVAKVLPNMAMTVEQDEEFLSSLSLCQRNRVEYPEEVLLVDKYFFCRMPCCGKECQNFDIYFDHLKEDHSALNILCPYCFRVYEDSTTFEKHLMCHGPNLYGCPLKECTLYTFLKRSIVEHLQNDHKIQIQSEIKVIREDCVSKLDGLKLSLFPKSKLEAHFSCLFCYYKTTDFKLMRNHIYAEFFYKPCTCKDKTCYRNATETCFASSHQDEDVKYEGTRNLEVEFLTNAFLTSDVQSKFMECLQSKDIGDKDILCMKSEYKCGECNLCYKDIANWHYHWVNCVSKEHRAITCHYCCEQFSYMNQLKHHTEKVHAGHRISYTLTENILLRQTTLRKLQVGKLQILKSMLIPYLKSKGLYCEKRNLFQIDFKWRSMLNDNFPCNDQKHITGCHDDKSLVVSKVQNSVDIPKNCNDHSKMMLVDSHTKAQAQNEPFICTLCDGKVQTMDELEQHTSFHGFAATDSYSFYYLADPKFNYSENDTELYECAYCNVSPANLFHLQGHYTDLHPRVPFKVRGKRFKDPPAIQCKHCDLKVMSQEMLEKHCLFHHFDRSTKSSENDKQQLKRKGAINLDGPSNKLLKDSSSKYQCAYCEESFLFYIQMITHHKAKHIDMILKFTKGSGIQLILCDFCSYLAEECLMTTHLVVKHKNCFVCPYCGKVSNEVCKIGDHIKTQHPHLPVKLVKVDDLALPITSSEGSTCFSSYGDKSVSNFGCRSEPIDMHNITVNISADKSSTIVQLPVAYVFQIFPMLPSVLLEDHAKTFVPQ